MSLDSPPPADGGSLPAPGWRPRAVTLLSLLISSALLVGLYRATDVRRVWQVLLAVEPAWLVFSIGVIVPITVLRAIRFFSVAPAGSLPGVGEALRLTLVGGALNVVIPMKAGDLIKSYFVATRGNTPAGVAIAIVVYERLCDLFGLITWCLVGWFVARPQVPSATSQVWLLLAPVWAVCGLLISSERVAALLPAAVHRLPVRGKWRKLHDLASGWPNLLRVLRGRRRWIVPLSMGLWLTHLVQMWLFTVALSTPVPFLVCATLAAMALMAGQVPLTIAGLGTRDVALVVLMSRYMPAESAAAMGILAASRNLLPPLLGMPMMRPYLSSVVDDARRWRREMELTE